MKKILTFLTVALATIPLFADIYSPHRFVEFGSDVEIQEGQNIISYKDIFVKDLVIDLNKIYDEMGNSGATFFASETADLFFNVNINGYGAGLKLSDTVGGSVNISKDFFKLLAEGNTLDTEETTSMSAYFESFINVSAPIYLRFNKIKLTATPTYFMPLAYLPNTTASLTYSANSDGKVRAKGHGEFGFYSIIDLGRGIETVYDEDGNSSTSFSFEGLGEPFELIKSILDVSNGTGGIDLGLQVEFPILSNLDFGAYANVPIIRGKLNSRLSGSVDFSFEMDGFMDNLTSSNQDDEPYKTDFTFSDLSSSSAEYYVNRPCRLGFELAFRPFGDWFILHPKVGAAVRNPFGEDFSIQSIYPEYSLEVAFTLKQILTAALTTSYIDKVFMHTVGFEFNARAIELDILVGTSGADFLKSFNLSGLKASVGLSFGF